MWVITLSWVHVSNIHVMSRRQNFSMLWHPLAVPSILLLLPWCSLNSRSWGKIDNNVPSMSDHSQSIFLSAFTIYSFIISHCLLQKEAWTRLQILEICGQKHRFSKHFYILAKNSSRLPLGAYVPPSHEFLARFKEPGMISSCEVGLISNQKAVSYPPNSCTSIS